MPTGFPMKVEVKAKLCSCLLNCINTREQSGSCTCLPAVSAIKIKSVTTTGRQTTSELFTTETGRQTDSIFMRLAKFSLSRHVTAGRTVLLCCSGVSEREFNGAAACGKVIRVQQQRASERV